MRRLGRIPGYPRVDTPFNDAEMPHTRDLFAVVDAGADHVAVQVLTKDENLVSALAELAGPLGLTPA